MPSELESLSPRERDILALIGDGLTNREIGTKLYLSEKTVKNHISRLPGSPSEVSLAGDRAASVEADGARKSSRHGGAYAPGHRPSPSLYGPGYCELGEDP